MLRNAMAMKLVLLGVLALGLAACGATVRPGQRGVKYWSLGTGLQKEVKRDGFYFLWPWNDMIKYDVT